MIQRNLERKDIFQVTKINWDIWSPKIFNFLCSCKLHIKINIAFNYINTIYNLFHTKGKEWKTYWNIPNTNRERAMCYIYFNNNWFSRRRQLNFNYCRVFIFVVYVCCSYLHSMYYLNEVVLCAQMCKSGLQAWISRKTLKANKAWELQRHSSKYVENKICEICNKFIIWILDHFVPFENVSCDIYTTILSI